MAKEKFEKIKVGHIIKIRVPKKDVTRYGIVIDKCVKDGKNFITVDADNLTQTYEIENDYTFDVIGPELEKVDKARFIKTITYSEHCKMYHLNSNMDSMKMKKMKKSDLYVSVDLSQDPFLLTMQYEEPIKKNK